MARQAASMKKTRNRYSPAFKAEALLEHLTELVRCCTQTLRPSNDHISIATMDEFNYIDVDYSLAAVKIIFNERGSF